jgi:hypothetical protein
MNLWPLTGELEPEFSSEIISYTLILPCGQRSVTFNVTPPYKGTAKFDNGVDVITVTFDAPGIKKIKAHAVAEDGVTSKDYEVTVICAYAPDIIRSYWYNVVAVNLNTATNGNFTFSAYQWTFNGQPIPGETGPYLHLNEVKDGYYSVLLTANGQVVPVCEAIYLTAAHSLKAYPNPVVSDVTVENIQENVSRLQLFDLSGRLLKEYPVGYSKTSLDLSEFPMGIYLLKAGEQTVKLIKN